VAEAHELVGMKMVQTFFSRVEAMCREELICMDQERQTMLCLLASHSDLASASLTRCSNGYSELREDSCQFSIRIGVRWPIAPPLIQIEMLVAAVGATTPPCA